MASTYAGGSGGRAGTWYCLVLSALLKCSGSPAGSNHPPGSVRFLLHKKCGMFPFRKSSLTDPFLSLQILFGQKKWLRRLDSNQGPSG